MTVRINTLSFLEQKLWVLNICPIVLRLSLMFTSHLLNLLTDPWDYYFILLCYVTGKKIETIDLFQNESLKKRTLENSIKNILIVFLQSKEIWDNVESKNIILKELMAKAKKNWSMTSKRKFLQKMCTLSCFKQLD